MSIQIEKSKLIKTYLCETDIVVYSPMIDFFHNLVQNKDYFGFTRWNAGWWDLLYYGMAEYQKNWPPIYQNKKPGQSLPLPEVLTDTYLTALAKECCLLRHAQLWYITEFAVIEILKTMVSPKPENFFCGITLRCWQNFNYNLNAGLPMVKKFCSRYINDLFYGYCWRTYGGNGQLDLFIQHFKDMPFMIVGASYLKGFGKIFGLKNFTFIEIPYRNAAKDIVQIYEKTLKSIQENTICFIVAGNLGTYIVQKLLNEFGKVFAIDLGRGLDHCANNAFYSGRNKLHALSLTEPSK